MDIDSFLKLAKERRSIRKFKPIDVPDEMIEQVIDAVRWAPSGANSQPWEFIVVKDAETKRRITEIFIEMTHAGKRFNPKFPFQPDDTVRAKFEKAPALVVVCSDPRFMVCYPDNGSRESTLNVSLGCALQTLHLAAKSLGLGSCFGTANPFISSAVKQVLGIPDPLEVKEVLSIGYPDQERVSQRRDLETVIHRERFEPAKWRSQGEIERLLESRVVADIYSGQKRKW